MYTLANWQSSSTFRNTLLNIKANLNRIPVISFAIFYEIFYIFKKASEPEFPSGPEGSKLLTTGEPTWTLYSLAIRWLDAPRELRAAFP